MGEPNKENNANSDYDNETNMQNELNDDKDGLNDDKDRLYDVIKNEPSVIAAVRKTDPYVRKRFTAAHELYHAIFDMLNELKIRGTSACFVRTLPDSTGIEGSENEQTANEFAAQLLMPYKKIKKEYDELHIKSVAVLADMFGVSPPVMKERLDNLGLKGYWDDVEIIENISGCDCKCDCNKG